MREKIENIIKKQTIADVPISLSLSGGIDSNILLSNINKNLSTYNISYEYMKNKSLDSILQKKEQKNLIQIILKSK